VFVVGIDLGRTKINGAIFDSEGNLLLQTAHLLENRKGPESGQLISETIRELLPVALSSTLLAIGICIPCVSDTATGRV